MVADIMKKRAKDVKRLIKELNISRDQAERIIKAREENRKGNNG